jgi:UDP-N-acetylglucosamine acyltransferase
LKVHPTAVIEEGAEIAVGVTIGPYCHVGREVVIEEGCSLASHVVVQGEVKIGPRCRIFNFASVGTDPQDLKYKGESTRLVVGEENTFREFVSVNRGTGGGGGVTTIGDRNFFMAYSHVAHDCHVGSGTIFANAATLAGHVEVEDYASIGAFCAVDQFCRVGQHAFI